MALGAIVDNTLKISEELYAELQQAVKSTAAVLIEKETLGPLKKVCFISNQIAALAVQEEQYVG